MPIEQKSGADDRIGTPLEKKLEGIIPPFERFTHDQTTGSILLIICTLAALLIANSPLDRSYETLLLTKTGLVFGDWSLTMSLRHWINDGLMSLFFFVLGLEIKRELLVGELKGARRSLPMIAAALGGMLMPALVYTAFTAGTPLVHGWGIPMATDTAFAVGVLALLRKHIPAGLTAFLTALAIIDDLGAILVIAVFYTETLNLLFLAAAALLFTLLIALNVTGIRRPGVYFTIGGLVWLAVLGSGVHATVAGVL
ncbi:MAG: Na+/H+ antiporter NhaA, partial [Gammaproteobacteria bacterium]